MLSRQRRKRMLYIYTLFLFVCAVSFVLMPIGGSMEEKTKIPMVISGVIFWIGLLGTVFTALKINRCRKNDYRFNKKFGNLRQPGLICFFRNRPALIFDSMMFISIAGVIVAKLCTKELLPTFIFLSLFVFSFGMHCMLNGINYKYIKIKYKIRRVESHE